ncbi:MAG: helix-turn-helix domain-containing protein [Planctomycetes bacterium]|nr:helix-turn-helix domain-containing protein [Planctomycetota bacterium]
MDHVLTHLNSSLRLEDVAQAAGFSPCHFHRVFKSLVGETLNDFVKRQRLERALRAMSHAPERSLTEIALDCGFSSSSDFSRSFKARYGVPPSAFDLGEWRKSKRAQMQETVAGEQLRGLLDKLPVGENPDGFEATIRKLPARTVAYIRVNDPYRGGVTEAVERLVDWARERGCADGQWLGYMWEDPEIVALEDCRYDAAVVVDDVQPEGEVGRYEFPELLVAEVVIRGPIDLEMRAIDWLYCTWLPRSGYEPDDQPSFEAWDGMPFAHGYEHFELAVQLPIRRAGSIPARYH